MADDKSIWKKEISFGRKKAKADAPVEKLVEPDAEFAPKASIWKKEISFGKKQPTATPEPAVAAAPPVAPVAPPAPQAAAPAAPPAPAAPAVPFADESAGEALGLEPERAPATPAAPVVPLPPSPPQHPVERPRAAGQDEPLPRAHLHSVEGTPAAQPVPAPQPGIHPPVPAAQLPELPKPAKTPFWKKELSVSLKPEEPREKAPKEPKQKAPKQPKPPKPERTPFWKRELSLKRTPKPKAERGAKQPNAKKLRKPPLWKREFSLRKPQLKGVAPKGGQNLKLVGLKIGASQVAAARVHNNGVPELVQIAREDLKAGVVVGGELRDTDALADALRTFFRKNKLPKRGVRLGIANNRIGVRTFDVVGIEDPQQLDNAVRFRAQEALPIPIDEAVLDYQILSESTDDEGQTVKRILLVVAYRELVDRYVAACKKAGIRLTGIDLEAFALLRALSAPTRDPGNDGAVVAVAIGSERSTFAVSDGAICQFTRVLDWGGASLDVAVARTLDLTPSQAEPFKRQLSLEPGATDPEGLSPERAEAARQAIRAQLQTFARELVSSLQFYQNQPESLGIGEIVVTGGSAHLPGLAAELQRLIGVLVRVGDPLARVKIGKKVDEGDRIGSLAVAIGLGIED